MKEKNHKKYQIFKIYTIVADQWRKYVKSLSGNNDIKEIPYNNSLNQISMTWSWLIREILSSGATVNLTCVFVLSKA